MDDGNGDERRGGGDGRKRTIGKGAKGRERGKREDKRKGNVGRGKKR